MSNKKKKTTKKTLLFFYLFILDIDTFEQMNLT